MGKSTLVLTTADQKLFIHADSIDEVCTYIIHFSDIFHNIFHSSCLIDVLFVYCILH